MISYQYVVKILETSSSTTLLLWFAFDLSVSGFTIAVMSKVSSFIALLYNLSDSSLDL